MTELSKYDIILDELNSFEKQIAGLCRKNTEILPKYNALEKANKHLLNENSSLKIKILELESKIESLLKEKETLIKGNNLFNNKEKEDLKLQIDGLINKINNHIRS